MRRWWCVAAALMAVVACSPESDGVIATTPGPSTAVTAATTAPPGPSTTQASVASMPVTASPEQASQSPLDAARDGVIPELAEIGLATRLSSMISVEAEEGTWVVSYLSNLPREPCLLGDPERPFPAAICTHEYAEILLMGDGAIVRAYPSPAAPLSWLYVAEEAVYSGRIGDGALPNSTLVRIDRATLEATVWVIEHTEYSTPYPPGWQIATEAQARQYAGLVSVVGEGLVADAIPGGSVHIDLAGIKAFFGDDS